MPINRPTYFIIYRYYAIKSMMPYYNRHKEFYKILWYEDKESMIKVTVGDPSLIMGSQTTGGK